jgi:alpha-galactosidase
MKAVFIGAGSFRFTYDLLRNFAALSSIMPFELWLVDIDAPLLGTVTRMLHKIAAKANISDSLVIHSSVDRLDALAGADTVIISISVGQQASEWFDIHIPNKFGIPHTTGDTCGPGGIMRAMRSIPEIIAIVKDIEKLCPDAMILNYTNPMSFITLAANQACPNTTTTGICHELLAGMPVAFDLLKKLGIKDVPKWESLEIEYSGINHFAWLLSVKYNGTDLYPVFRQNADLGIKTSKRPASFMLLKELGYFPYPGSRHVLEFMPEYFNYFNAEAVWRAYNRPVIRNIPPLIQYEGIPRLRGVKLLENQRKLVILAFKVIARGILPAPSPTFEGERVIEMIEDRITSRVGGHDKTLQHLHPVNVINTGRRIVSNLPENCVVETTGFFENGKIETRHNIKLPDNIQTLVKPFADNQQRVIDAAFSGDPDKLLDALINDPVCAFIEDKDAVRDMMLNMLHYQKRWLPQFKDHLPEHHSIRKLRHHIDLSELKGPRARQIKYPPKAYLSSKAVFPSENRTFVF